MPDLSVLPRLGDKQEQADTEIMIARANDVVTSDHQTSPFYASVYYSSIKDMCTRIGALMKPGDVLWQLEISADGSPRGCGGLDLDKLDSPPGQGTGQGQQLMAMRWDDNANLYLAGCNSGTKDKDQPASLATALAAAMNIKTPVVALSNVPFGRHLKVWGTLGYLQAFISGTHLTVTTNQVCRVKKDATADATPYVGARDANGQACWSENPNFP